PRSSALVCFLLIFPQKGRSGGSIPMRRNGEVSYHRERSNGGETKVRNSQHRPPNCNATRRDRQPGLAASGAADSRLPTQSITPVASNRLAPAADWSDRQPGVSR